MTVGAEGGPLAAFRARLEALSEDGERELLVAIIRDGWEAGCWFRVDDAELIRADAGAVDEFLAYARERTTRRVSEPDPFPDGLPRTAIDGDDPCWVVIGQKCDLVAGLSDEPFVELARAYDLGDKGLAGNLWKNSNRVFPLDPAAKDWVVDLRHRALLPKDRLPMLAPVRQAVPEDATQAAFKPRARFLRRIGQRYSRAAVPSEFEALVYGLLDLNGLPIVTVVFRDLLMKPLSASESAVVAVCRERTDPIPVERVRELLASSGIEPSASVESTLAAGENAVVAAIEIADELLDAVLDRLDPELESYLDRDESIVVDADDLTMKLWEECWRLDSDFLSYQRRTPGDAAMPYAP